MIKLIILSVLFAFGAAAPSDIVRPCHLSDYKCITDNLAANSKCNPNVRGSLPNVIKVPKFKFQTPYFNSTYVEKDLTIQNLDKCYVAEFFFNLTSDIAVLGLRCPQLHFEAKRTLVYHHSLQQDTEYSYDFEGTYPDIVLTTSLYNANRLNICKSYTFTDVKALPYFKINPNNKSTKEFLAKDLVLLNIFEIETFAERGRWLARDYVNAYLCDFGCRYVYGTETP